MANHRFYLLALPLLWIAVIATLSEPSFSFDHSLSFFEQTIGRVTHRFPHHAAEITVMIFRKSAHVIEYGILAGLLWTALEPDRFKLGPRTPTGRVATVLILVFIVACLDEIRQIGMAGRIGQFSDALIDFAGGVLVVTSLQLRTLRRGRTQ